MTGMFGVSFEAYVVYWIGMAVITIGVVIASVVSLIRKRDR